MSEVKELTPYEHYLATSRTPFSCANFPKFNKDSDFIKDREKYNSKFDRFKELTEQIESIDEKSILIDNTITFIKRCVINSQPSKYIRYFTVIESELRELKASFIKFEVFRDFCKDGEYGLLKFRLNCLSYFINSFHLDNKTKATYYLQIYNFGYLQDTYSFSRLCRELDVIFKSKTIHYKPCKLQNKLKEL